MQLKRILVISTPVIILGIPLAVIGAFYLSFLNKIYPNTFVVNQIDVSARTIEQAEETLKQALADKNTLVFSFPKGNTAAKETISFEDINLTYQTDKTAEKALRESRINLSNRFKQKKNISYTTKIIVNCMIKKSKINNKI